MTRIILAVLAGTALLAVAVSCGERALQSAGQECRATTECEDGLLCDFGQDPPVCAGEGTNTGGTPDASVDAAPNAPDAAVDAAIDAAVDAAVDAAI